MLPSLHYFLANVQEFVWVIFTSANYLVLSQHRLMATDVCHNRPERGSRLDSLRPDPSGDAFIWNLKGKRRILFAGKEHFRVKEAKLLQQI